MNILRIQSLKRWRARLAANEEPLYPVPGLTIEKSVKLAKERREARIFDCDQQLKQLRDQNV